MLKANYDKENNLVTMEFEGMVDAAQAEDFLPRIQKVVPRDGKGFKLLTDFTSLKQMDIEVQDAIKKTMDFFNQKGVKEIVRVIPSPEQDFGFNIMSIFHYSKDIKSMTLQSRKEAEERLRKNPGKKAMRAARISRTGGPLELVECEIPQPASGQVRIKVQACGVCHSDALVQQGQWPGIQYPRVPGHEVVGIVDAVNADVSQWKPGQRVGVGWYGGHCGHCKSCRKGDFILCRNLQITGISFDGGYAEYMVAPAAAVALVPDDLSPADAAPLMCAGITTFNALRNSHAQAGDLVAILGLGGLGHLGVQYAVKMGFKTVGIARGKDKEPLAKKLGAHHYIDSQAQDPAAELQKLGGAKVILATAASGDAMSKAAGGLAVNGSMIVIGADQSMQVSPIFLLGDRKSTRLNSSH